MASSEAGTALTHAAATQLPKRLAHRGQLPRAAGEEVHLLIRLNPRLSPARAQRHDGGDDDDNDDDGDVVMMMIMIMIMILMMVMMMMNSPPIGSWGRIEVDGGRRPTPGNPLSEADREGWGKRRPRTQRAARDLFVV
jgi:hypothetical protein